MNPKDKEKIDKLTEDITIITKSQEERLELDRVKSLNVMNFINAQICKAEAKNGLKQATINKIKTMIDGEDEEVSFIALLKLLEILDRSDDALTIGLGNMAAFSYKDKPSKDSIDNPSNKVEISNEDIQKLKKLSTILEKLESSEFPENNEEN